MRNPPFRTNDSPRQMQSGSDRPLGFLRSIKQQIKNLSNDITGLELRMKKRFEQGEPASIVSERVFAPDLAQTFNFDYLQDGVSSVASQFVLRDGVTYEIPIQFPPPGVMVVRFMKVRLYQRLFVTGIGPMQIPMNTGDYALRNFAEFQTLKYSFPDNATVTRNLLSRRVNFFWNLLDMKSGYKFSDQMIPDEVLLPQAGPGVAASSISTAGDFGPIGNNASVTNEYLEFLAPWPFEHDAQASFLFRPITPVIQPSAADAYNPYPFDDRENGGLTRDSSVTLHIELIGTRYYTQRDSVGKGALVDRYLGGRR